MSRPRSRRRWAVSPPRCGRKLARGATALPHLLATSGRRAGGGRLWKRPSASSPWPTARLRTTRLLERMRQPFMEGLVGRVLDASGAAERGLWRLQDRPLPAFPADRDARAARRRRRGDGRRRPAARYRRHHRAADAWQAGGRGALALCLPGDGLAVGEAPDLPGLSLLPSLRDGPQRPRAVSRPPRLRAHRAHFCDAWDQASFDPAYDTLPIEAFTPMLHRLFEKPKWKVG